MTQAIKIKIIARLLHSLLFLHLVCVLSRAEKPIFFKEDCLFININFDFILSSSEQNTDISLRFVYQNIANHEWHIIKLLTQVISMEPINYQRGHVFMAFHIF